MEHGKEPLVNPSAEWVQDYKSGVTRHRASSSSASQPSSSSPSSPSSPSSSSSSSTVIRRRHRRRITPQTKYSRQRIVKMIVVCCVLFAIMSVAIYFFLSRQEPVGEGSSLAPAVGSVG